jgi:hypothetical protein
MPASAFPAFDDKLILSSLTTLGKDLLTSALLDETINDTAKRHRIVLLI